MFKCFGVMRCIPTGLVILLANRCRSARARRFCVSYAAILTSMSNQPSRRRSAFPRGCPTSRACSCHAPVAIARRRYPRRPRTWRSSVSLSRFPKTWCSRLSTRFGSGRADGRLRAARHHARDSAHSASRPIGQSAIRLDSQGIPIVPPERRGATGERVVLRTGMSS